MGQIVQGIDEHEQKSHNGERETFLIGNLT